MKTKTAWLELENGERLKIKFDFFSKHEYETRVPTLGDGISFVQFTNKNEEAIRKLAVKAFSRK